MIPHDVGDYVVVRNQEKEKNFLCSVLEIRDDEITVVKYLQTKDNGMEEIGNKCIIANLGNTPIFGEKVYNIVIEHELRTAFVDGWGDISYYRKLDKESRLRIKKCIKEATEKINKTAFSKLLPIDKTLIKVNKGKTVGTYKAAKKKDDIEELTLMPNDDMLVEESELLLSIYHEFGHKLWINMPTGKRYYWTNTFRQNVLPIQPTDETMEEIKAIVAASSSIKEAKKELDKEYHPILKHIISYINKNYKIGKNIDDILYTNNKKLIEMWPQNIDSIKWGNYQKSVSDYGNKSPVEDFCECFAYYMLDKTLDEYNATRIEKTLDVVVSKKTDTSKEEQKVNNDEDIPWDE